MCWWGFIEGLEVFGFSVKGGKLGRLWRGKQMIKQKNHTPVGFCGGWFGLGLSRSFLFYEDSTICRVHRVIGKREIGLRVESKLVNELIGWVNYR
jgi:hypothetical protein